MPSRKFWVLATQGAFSGALLGYLGYQAWRHDSFSRLLDAPKDPTMLMAAWFAAFLALILTLVRWWLLARALDLPLPMRDTLRIGFVAYFINLIGVGVVGGDALKALFLAGRMRGRRTEALTTILFDRALGLYVLVCLSAIGLGLSQFEGDEETATVITRVGQGAQLFAALGTVGLALLFAPGLAHARFWDRLGAAPVVGRMLRQLVAAGRMYRTKHWHVAGAIGLSVLVHSLFVFMFYFLAAGFSMERPTLAAHFVIVPAAMAAGTLPIGTQEVVLNALYRAALPTAGEQGFLLTLAYRVIQILISGVGIAFYLTSKGEMDRLLDRRQASAPEGEH